MAAIFNPLAALVPAVGAAIPGAIVPPTHVIVPTAAIVPAAVIPLSAIVPVAL